MARIDITVPDHLMEEFRNAAAARSFDTLSAWGRDALICSLRSGSALVDLERRLASVFVILEQQLKAIRETQQATFQMLESLIMLALVRLDPAKNTEELKARKVRAEADYKKILERNAEIAAASQVAERPKMEGMPNGTVRELREAQ